LPASLPPLHAKGRYKLKQRVLSIPTPRVWQSEYSRGKPALASGKNVRLMDLLLSFIANKKRRFFGPCRPAAALFGKA
jgi:hypothetical protein